MSTQKHIKSGKYFYLLLIFAGLFIFTNCGQKPIDGYKLTGTISGLPDGKAVLRQLVDGEWKDVDTTDIKEGKFVFDGKVQQPELFRIFLSDTLPTISLFIDNHEISVTGVKDSLGSVKITGSLTQDEYDNFNKSIETVTNSLDSVDNLWVAAKQAGNDSVMAVLDTLYDKIDNERKEKIQNYVLKNNKSVVSAYLTWTQLGYALDVKALDSISTNFDSTLNSSVYAKLLKDYIEILKKVEIGQPAPDFTLNDTTGTPVALSSLFGKYLLIDFWASWCGPCRRENPNVVAAYHKYHKKGFDILGVSFDKTRDKWVKAINKDGLAWHHVSDLKYWGNAAGKLYGIRSIPSNVLLDPSGVIIAKNLRGEALLGKLDEIFSKKMK